MGGGWQAYSAARGRAAESARARPGRGQDPGYGGPSAAHPRAAFRGSRLERCVCGCWQATLGPGPRGRGGIRVHYDPQSPPSARRGVGRSSSPAPRQTRPPPAALSLRLGQPGPAPPSSSGPGSEPGRQLPGGSLRASGAAGRRPCCFGERPIAPAASTPARPACACPRARVCVLFVSSCCCVGGEGPGGSRLADNGCCNLERGCGLNHIC